jgi:hypothetical protein
MDKPPDTPPPDFAMKRAVEILAKIYESQREKSGAPPVPFDCVVVLFNENVTFDVTKTTRREVERALGIAFAYPVRGWHTYCVRGAGGREFVSLFYEAPAKAHSALVSAELYLPKVDRAPPLEARDLGGVRLVPGEIAIGTALTSLPENFARIEKPQGLGPYADIFEARFPGGSAYAMGNNGTIERLAIYGLRA